MESPKWTPIREWRTRGAQYEITCCVCGELAGRTLWSSNHVMALCRRCNQLMENGWLELAILVSECDGGE